MKQRVFSLITAYVCSFLAVQAQDVMVIEKTDNTVVEINVDNVRQVTFRTQSAGVYLSSSTLNLQTGFGGQVHILSGSGNYSASVADPTVAHASIEKQEDGSAYVYITALMAGSTIITVTDVETGMTAEVHITVNDEALPLSSDEYVDLGLGSRTLWATQNVGASSPEEFGWYVSWGETAEKEHYAKSDYSLVSIGNVLDLTDGTDVACMMLNGDWRMPTQAELEELFSCTWSWEKQNGVQGVRITGPNGNAIFLPAASFKDDTQGNPTNGVYGSYWGRTHADPTYPCGSELIFGIVNPYDGWNNTNFYYTMGKTGFVYCGRSVRPVYGKLQSQANGNDYTGFMANPTFDNNNYDWWLGTRLSGYNPDDNAEHYNKDFDTYQVVGGLPAGQYEVGVQGFYRRGSYSDDYALWQNGDTSGMNAQLYATSSVDAQAIPLASISSAALPSSLGGNASSVGDGLYVPNDMVAARAWMDAGYYHNYMNVNVGADGKLIIGIKKDTTISGDWTIIDNWSLVLIQNTTR